MLKMLVVLVIVVRPHTGTLRGLRRRLFSRLVTDPRSGADRGRNTRPEHVRLRSPHGRTWTPGPSKNFRLRRALFTKKHIRFLHLMGAGPGFFANFASFIVVTWLLRVLSIYTECKTAHREIQWYVVRTLDLTSSITFDD